MGPSIFTAILALSLGFVFPSRVSLVRFQCVPGAYLPDSDDCSRYYQCTREGSIRFLVCPAGTRYCGESEQLCCSEPIDSKADIVDNATKKNDDSEHLEQSSDGSGPQNDSANVKSDADDRSSDFVGQRLQVTTRNEEIDKNPVQEEYNSTTEHIDSIDEKPAGVDELQEETDATAKVDVNVVVESDGGPTNVSAGNDQFNHDSSDKEVASQYGHVNNPASENVEEKDNNEARDNRDDKTVADAVEKTMSIEVPKNPEINESRELFDELIYRKKRNDFDTKIEDASLTERIDEGKEEMEKDNHNEDSDIEVSTVLSSGNKVDEEDQPVVATSHDSVEDGDKERSNPESDGDNLKSEILGTDKPRTLNPSLVKVDAGGLTHSYPQEDNKRQKIVQIVKNIIRLADEQPYLIHREMPSPENDDHLKTTMAP